MELIIIHSTFFHIYFYERIRLIIPTGYWKHKGLLVHIKQSKMSLWRHFWLKIFDVAFHWPIQSSFLIYSSSWMRMKFFYMVTKRWIIQLNYETKHSGPRSFGIAVLFLTWKSSHKMCYIVQYQNNEYQKDLEIPISMKDIFVAQFYSFAVMG